MIKARFACYGHSEDVELEMPADFWELDECDRDELMDNEYDDWCDGGRTEWELWSAPPPRPKEEEDQDYYRPGIDYDPRC